MVCWGQNTRGQLGTGSNGEAWAPQPVAGLTDVNLISAGGSFTCANSFVSGPLRCWGSNSAGQLLDGTFTDRNSPVEAAFNDWGELRLNRAGLSHVCTPHGSGYVWCWGDNEHGQLGDGTMTDRTTSYVEIGTDNTGEATCGWHHTCARRGTGFIECGGRNTSGQLGDGTTTMRTTAVGVIGIGDASVIAAGEAHTCAVRATGVVECWGSNARGQLGDGTLEDSPRPVRVASL